MSGFNLGSVGFVGSLSGGGAVVAPESATYRYNMGGPSYTDPAGNVWAPLSNGEALSNGTALEAPSPEPGIYTTLIYGPNDGGPAFTITGLPNGNYRAKAYLRESGDPNRNFALQAVGGGMLIATFNVFTAAGGNNRPLVVTAPVLAPVTAGSLSLTMTETNMTLYGLTLTFVP